MPFNFRLNVQSVFRRLGIQTGARLPQLDDNIQMSMLVTDLSRLVPAPIEPRGLAGVNLPGSLGNFSVCQLWSLAEGGIFIENLIFRGDGFPSSEDYMIDVTLTNLGLAVNPGHINAGGSPVRSIFTAGEVPVTTGGAPMPATVGKAAVEFRPGIFCPNQALFSISSLTKNKRLDVAIVYRELPSVEEVG